MLVLLGKAKAPPQHIYWWSISFTTFIQFLPFQLTCNMQVPDINGTICFSCCSSMHWKLQISSIHLMDLLHIAHAIQMMLSSAHCLKIWIILPVMIYGRAWTKVVLLILTCWRWHLVWNARHPCYKMQHQYVTLPTLSYVCLQLFKVVQIYNFPDCD